MDMEYFTSAAVMIREDLLSSILKRSESIFADDLADNLSRIRDGIRGSRIMVIGAAGSVGSAFIRQLIPYEPGALHLVDISENNLVEVVRDLRSSLIALPDDFKTFAISTGSEEFNRLLQTEEDYDYLANFSALKHVRSEKDPYSLMRMYNTNVYYVKQLLDALVDTKIRKHFSVSSDKATNPENIMGATKIFMERILLSYADRVPFSTARFANVAFSDGSLLYGFMYRLAKRQPLSAPSDVKRYFISHEEAGQLCLLSCFLGENREVYFPKLDRNKDLLSFPEIALMVLEAEGFRPVICDSEEEAKMLAGRLTEDTKEWPCWFSPSDTTGEKAVEEFYTTHDQVDFNRYRQVGVIRQPAWSAREKIDQALYEFERIKETPSWKKEKMVEAIKIAVPELQHRERNKSLDQKM
jgi:nucleoside-diphosphate-sugar epimerase